MPEAQRSLSDMAATVGQAAALAQRYSEGGGVEPVSVLACDDGIKVTASPPGTVRIEILEPRSLKLGSDEVGEALTEAVNRALDALRERISGAVALDPGALAEQFTEISGQGDAAFADLLDSVVRLQRTDSDG